MATSETKCPVCGKLVGVGLVSRMLVQHENKYGERCDGSGGPAVSASTRTAAAPREKGAASRPSASRSPSAAAAPATPRHGGVTVRRVEVDPERLRRMEEKQQRLREERAEAARRRNEFYSSGFEIGDAEAGAAGDSVSGDDVTGGTSQ